MTLPFVDLTRLSREIYSRGGPPRLVDDFRSIIGSAAFVDGAHAAEFERNLATRLGVNHVVACANGTDALVLSLMALGIGPGDVVAIPALTFWATYEAVHTVGATAMVIDVDDHGQISLDALRGGDRWPNAVILVHLFGWASGRVAETRAWCSGRGIPLIEDGAQAFGVEIDGASVFSGATIATLSFYPTKVLGGCGNGGAVVCKHQEHAALLRSMRNHGRVSSHEHTRAGINSRMSEICAAYLSHALRMSEQIVSPRRRAVDIYRELLDGRNGLRVHAPPPNVKENGYLCVVSSEYKSGGELAAMLADNGIGSGRTYPKTIADQVGFDGIAGDISNARRIAERTVNLPLFYGITRDEQERVAKALL